MRHSWSWSGSSSSRRGTSFFAHCGSCWAAVIPVPSPWPPPQMVDLPIHTPVERAKRKTAALAGERPIVFACIVAPPTGAIGVVGASVSDGCPMGLQVLFGAIGALLGLIVGVAVITLVYWCRSRPEWEMDRRAQEIRTAIRDLNVRESLTFDVQRLRHLGGGGGRPDNADGGVVDAWQGSRSETRMSRTRRLSPLRSGPKLTGLGQPHLARRDRDVGGRPERTNLQVAGAWIGYPGLV